MKKISVSTGTLQNLFGEKGAILKAKEAGADGVDFNLWSELYDINNKNSIYAKSNEELTKHFEDIKDYAKKIGMEIFTTHGNGTGYKNIKEDDELLIKNVFKDILATKALGAKICVLHTAGNYHLPPETPSEEMFRMNYELFDKTLPFAKENGIILATETFGSSSRYGCIDFFGNDKNFLEGFMPVYEKYGDSFCVCVDTGHTNLTCAFGCPSVEDIIKSLNKHVKALHLHDNNGLKDQHKIPGTGDIIWQNVLKTLDEINYTGTYNLEVAPVHYGKDFAFEETLFSVKALKQLLKISEV